MVFVMTGLEQTASWRLDERELWSRIAAYRFEQAGDALTFTKRLARDHGWSIEGACAAIEEYRRFCFLAVTAESEMTPSEDVDEVWHLHLTYSRDYWERWCRHTLLRPLHHSPTVGGRAEGTRFAEQYAQTLARYERFFGPPDPAHWPGTARRFRRPRFATVDRDRAIIVPLPAVLGELARRAAVVCKTVALLILRIGGTRS